jgi:hypothetical protein
MARMQGYSQVQQEIVVSPGNTPFITLRMETGAGIQGTVLSPQYQPLAGVRVNTWLQQGGERMTYSGDNGFYQLDALPEGEYDLQFYYEGQPPLTGQLYRVPAGSTGADITLEPNEWLITGTVADQVTQQPLQRYSISIHGNPDAPTGRLFMQTRMINSPDGTYQLAVHETGTYMLTFTAEGYQPQTGKVAIGKSYRNRQFLNISLQPVADESQTGGITGSLNPPPNSVLGAVTVVGINMFPSQGNQFLLQNLPPGQYDLIFHVQEQDSSLLKTLGGLSVNVRPGQNTNLPPIQYQQLQVLRN